jgi:glycosyltransferase involved in cell wall biosynthesis
MGKRNIVFIDMPLDGQWEFVEGLEAESNEAWEVKSYVCNEGRTTRLSNIVRYGKYFFYSFLIFLNRNKYDRILCWQSFFGIIYASFCALFRVKKKNRVFVQNFIYRPKGGGGSFIGRLYFRWLRRALHSGYVDLFISASLTNCKYCAGVFEMDPARFRFVPFSLEDASLLPCGEVPPATPSDYVLSLGRSNRDWRWLIESFRDSGYRLIIICDELHYPGLPPNVTVLNQVWGKDAYPYVKHCRCMIIPILDGSIDSGDMVLIRSMSFSKPVIINRPSCLADDYVIDGHNGLVVDRKREDLLAAVERLCTDEQLYRTLAENARKDYLSGYTVLQYGKNIALQIKRYEA